MSDLIRSPNSATGHSSRLGSPLPHQRNDDQLQSTNASNTRVLQRNGGLQRSSTVDIPHDKPQNYPNLPPQPASDQGHARTADPNYNQSYGSFSRPASRGGPSSYSDENRTGNSLRSTNNSTSNVSQTSSSNSSPTTTTPSVQPCSACGLAMSGQFVRALGSVYHLDCFRCKDCNTVVAQKFFPIEGQDGKQYPLCERDYFKRLNLICANCGMALRASYITACGKKYHVEHFTCSVCPTVFGPQDSYYEHEGNVYCHFHYSTRFATKCVGCGIAILKQFVEINRNMRDECWHPECYMIHKFWSVKLSNKRVDSLTADSSQAPQEQRTSFEQEEHEESAESLKTKQVKMEKQVYRIWTVLSAFEESSAACISDMLRHVSNGHYLEAVRMAERFILHVEVLFGTIDDLETHFAHLSSKGMAHVREARMLCRKTVDLFTLLSHTQETGERRVGMTQEMLALVTGLAHYLKILIRIALTGALKLERDYNFGKGLVSFLDHLQALATNKGNPAARRIKADSTPSPEGACQSTQGVSYGYKSLSPENAGESPFDGSSKPLPPPSDLCISCRQTVEEDCVRLGTYRRWHSACVKCASCGKVAAVPLPPKEPLPVKDDDEREGKVVSKAANTRRPAPSVNDFVFEPAPLREGAPTAEVSVASIYCVDHVHPGCERGFQAVTRLEQYAFLLSVALRRLYIVLRRKAVIPMSAAAAAANHGTEPQGFGSDAYRNSSDVMRMNSTVALDRKLSARVPRRSTIVESPSGKTVQAGDTSHHPQRIQGQPELHNQKQVIPTLSNTPPTPSTPTIRQPQPRSAAANTPLLQPRSPTTSPAPLQDYTSPLGSPNASDEYRPSFARHNTQIKIIKDPSVPTSPAHEQLPGTLEGVDPLAAIMLGGVPEMEKYQRPLIGILTPLELSIIKHAAVLSLSKSPLKEHFDLDEILEMVEAKKGGWWGKLFRGGGDKKKKTGVFGVPLEQLVDRQGTDSVLGAPTTMAGATLRIPSIVDDLISAMRQMDMSVEGIFRKNGNIRRLNKLAEAVDQDPSVDLTQESAVQLAVLLKKFLRELPEPLLTFKLYNLFVASQILPNQQDRQRYLHYTSIILPKPNRDTLEALFVFLNWVASFAHVDEETGSKMDLQNLATVICPNILYSSKNRDAAHTESVIAIPVVTELLLQQDEYWQVPEEFLPLLQDQEYFANCLDLTSKEFLKRCEQYYRVKASGRQPTPYGGGGLMSPSLQHPNGNAMSTPQPWSDNDVRLVSQRSDSAIPRGRPPVADSSRPSNSNRYKQDSHSLERGAQQRDWPSGSPSKGGQTSQHPVSPYSQGVLASPSQNLLSDAEWAAAQKPPPPILTSQGRSRSGSRPGSVSKTSEEASPSSGSTNGRYSPPRPGLPQ